MRIPILLLLSWTAFSFLLSSQDSGKLPGTSKKVVAELSEEVKERQRQLAEGHIGFFESLREPLGSSVQ